MPLKIRRARSQDYADVARLLNTFSVDEIDEKERRQGFVQGTFSAEDIAAFARSLSVIVAHDGDLLVGAMCASALLPLSKSGPLSVMIEQLDHWRFDHQRINRERCISYGPVCIDRQYQGRGLLKSLFRELLRQVGGRFDLGLAFVDHRNVRSMDAHQGGLGMRRLGDFCYNGWQFSALAFEVPHK